MISQTEAADKKTQKRPFSRKTRMLATLFVLAFLWRILFFAAAFHVAGGSIEGVMFSNDGYHEIAESLLLGHGWSSQAAPPFLPEIARMPAYPLFIAGILYLTHSYWFVAILQIIIGSILPLLSYLIVIEITKRKKIALITGFIIAIEPIFMLMSFVLLTETLAAFFWLVSLLAFLRHINRGDDRYLAWSGIFLGLATLTRPTTLYLPILLCGFMAWMYRTEHYKIVCKKVFLFAGVFVITLSPWIIRNAITLHSVSLTRQPGIQFYTTFLPSAIALENRIPFETARADVLLKYHIDQDNTSALTNADLKYLRSQSFGEAMRHKKGVILASLMSAATFLTQDGYINFLGKIGQNADIHFHGSSLVLLFTSPSELFNITGKLFAGPGILILLGRIFWIVALALSLFGLYRFQKNGKHSRKIAVFLLLVSGYFVLTACLIGFGVSARYRMPIDPIIIGLALYGLSSGISKASGRQ